MPSFDPLDTLTTSFLCVALHFFEFPAAHSSEPLFQSLSPRSNPTLHERSRKCQLRTLPQSSCLNEAQLKALSALLFAAIQIQVQYLHCWNQTILFLFPYWSQSLCCLQHILLVFVPFMIQNASLHFSSLLGICYCLFKLGYLHIFSGKISVSSLLAHT